uniref:feruloyl-CoA synthase n=1 Tax=Pseudomonas sp. TaxID=306 RepID=UPI0026224D21
GFVLRSPDTLQPYARCVGEWLEHWRSVRSDQTFLAERREGQWYRLSYGQARQQIGALAQGLLDMDLAKDAPLVVLSENDIDHALLTLAAMHIGVPVATISVAYSPSAGDCTKLHTILRLLGPAVIFANDAKRFAHALIATHPDCPVIVARNHDQLGGAIHLGDLYGCDETPAVMAAFEQVTPGTTARYSLTSGSTGAPKVVVTTQRMLCANQQSIAQCWRFVEHSEMIVLDWLPWSHVFGANHNFNLVLRNGGSLYIDDGRPIPGAIERTLENIASVRPTLFFNVPKGYEVMLPFLESDDALARCFFERLEMVFFAGAALPPSLWQRLKTVAARVSAKPLFFSSAWGATETSPVLTMVHYPTQVCADIGLPVPGIEIKFVPNGDKLEMRVRGDSVFNGYRNSPELSTLAFDEEGYYFTGDAGELIDPFSPQQGVRFNGRIAEDFKLTTGTWVSVSALRVRVLSALSPYVQDCVITGHDRDELGALLFVSPALRELAGEGGHDMSAEKLAACVAVRGVLLAGILRLAEETPASSQHIQRLVILDTPANPQDGEITDKGYINQRQSLNLRADQVSRLYAEQLDPAVFLLAQATGALSHAI